MYTPEFPRVMDNTQVSTFKACGQLFNLEYNECLRGSTESIHLIAGGAFAAGCEAARRAFFIDGKPEMEALAEGVRVIVLAYGDIDIQIGADDKADNNYCKSFERIIDAFLAYFGVFENPAKCINIGAHRLGTDPYQITQIGEHHGIEFSATAPTGIDHPDTGEDIPYSIRFDALVESEFGLLGMDEKTAKTMDKNWAEKWNLRSQFLNYIKVAQLNDIPMQGIVTRGVVLQKTQFHFPEALVIPSQHTIDKCWNDTLHAIDLAKHYYIEGQYYPSNYGEHCNAFGGCPFRNMCQSADPESWFDQYARARWNPLKAELEILQLAPEVSEDNPLTL